MSKKNEKWYDDPIDIPEEEIEVIDSGDDESDDGTPFGQGNKADEEDDNGGGN